jgi:hypothetical protein
MWNHIRYTASTQPDASEAHFERTHWVRMRAYFCIRSCMLHPLSRQPNKLISHIIRIHPARTKEMKTTKHTPSRNSDSHSMCACHVVFLQLDRQRQPQARHSEQLQSLSDYRRRARALSLSREGHRDELKALGDFGAAELAAFLWFRLQNITARYTGREGWDLHGAHAHDAPSHTAGTCQEIARHGRRHALVLHPKIGKKNKAHSCPSEPITRDGRNA